MRPNDTSRRVPVPKHTTKTRANVGNGTTSTLQAHYKQHYNDFSPYFENRVMIFSACLIRDVTLFAC